MSSTLKAKIEAKEPGAYQQLMDADPTKRKTYIPWLCDLFLNHGLLLEDLPKASAYLPVFHQHKNNLPNTADGKPGRKIGSYSSLPQLYRAVAQYLPEEVQDPEQDLAADAPQDIIELFHENGLRIVIPLSSAAATREGRGTQWCTAYGTAPNHFWNYASEGPLLIVRMQDKTGETNKYQLHFASGQFQDAANEEIKLDHLTCRYPDLWPVLEPYAQANIAQNGWALEYVPEELRDKTMCLAAVTRNGYALEHVPEELRDEAMCLAAVTQNGCALEYVPKELRDEKVCMAAVTQDWCVLEHVPEELRDEAMCLAAITQSGVALVYVPEVLRDEKMCLAAVTRNGCALKDVPEELRDEKMCPAAVMQDGRALDYVPKKLRDEKMCLAAVMQDGRALEYVPEVLRDKTMCMAAIRQDVLALDYVPKKLRDEKMCLAAVKRNGMALGYVPGVLRDKTMCLAAVKRNGWALGYVPEVLRDEKMCLAAVTRNGWALKDVPEELRDEAMCMAAIMQDVRALEYVPKEQRSPDICKAAVQSLLRKAQEQNEPVELENFHHIPNKWQDFVAKECGLGFDAKGFMTVKPPEPNVPRSGIGRVGTPMPPALQAA